MQRIYSANVVADCGCAAVTATEAERGRERGGSVSSIYRPQQQHSLKYFIASSPEMKKEGGSEDWESERDEEGAARGSGETEISTEGM